MYITASGLACAVGLEAASACAAMRAGIGGFAELPYYDNKSEPIVGAAVPDLEPDLNRQDRALRLLDLAVGGLLEQLTASTLADVPIFIGLAEPGRPGGIGGLADRALGLLQDRLKVRLHSASRGFATGHTAGFEGLRAARELMKAGKALACIVCAADSYINATSLLWLNNHSRLKTPDLSDGVIPGEAGAAVFVTSRPPPSGPPVRLRGLGFAHEPAHVLAKDPILGLGLAAAAKQGLAEAGLPMHDIDFRLADVTGEQYGFKELALLQTRLMRQRREHVPLWHPAQSIGDTGAAAGLVGLAVIREAFAKKYAPGSRVMLTTGSVGGDRAVAVLTEGER